MDYRIDAEDREILRELAKKQLQYANEEKTGNAVRSGISTMNSRENVP